MKRLWLGIFWFFILLCGAAEPSASLVLLYDREEVTVNPDGTSRTTDECIYRIVNYDGLTGMRSLQLHYNSDYGTLQVTHLAIVKPDGRKTVLDPAQLSSVSVEDSQMASSIYDPANKILTLRVPGLEIGDKLEVTTLEVTTKSRLPGHWSDITVLQAAFPIEYYEYIVHTPADKPLRGICIKDEVPGTITYTNTEKDGIITYRWIARNVPQVVPEKAMPPLYTCIQRVLVSTVGSWEEISRWYDALCAPKLAAVSGEMRNKAAELIAGKATDMEKITALFQFVSQQIRYTGITDEKSAPGYEPHDVSQTFERRHGVCRDKAALLVAMLRLAGFNASPVLFMSGSPKDPEVANIYFNHAIAGVELADGQFLLMDPTFETTTELFPGYLAGFPYLAAKPDGATLSIAPQVDALDHHLDIQSCGTMEEKKSDFVTTVKFSGVYDQMYRAAFSEWTGEDIENFFSSRLRLISPGARLTEISIHPENIRDMSKELHVTLHYTIPHAPVPEDSEKLLSIPRCSLILGMLNAISSHIAPGSRRFPLMLLPRSVSEKITLKLPEEFELTLPENLHVTENGLFRVSGDHRFQNGTLSEEFFFAVDTMRLSPADYYKFKSAVSQAGFMWQSQPVICRKTGYDAAGANIEILEHSRHYQLRSSDSRRVETRYIRKILNYAGVKEAANLTVPFIEGSETLEISATVTDSQGRSFTLSDKEINYMDDPATASAPRYLKRKLAVISFPGVDAGSIIDCRIVRHVADQPFFYTEMLTRSDTPARLCRVIIEHPAQMRLTAAIPENIRHSSTMGGKNIIRRYEISDTPRLPYEPGQPPYSFFIPALRISGFTIQELYGQITAAALEKVSRADESVAALARQLAADAPECDIAGKDQLQQIHSPENLRRIYIAYALEKYLYQHIREIDLPLNKMLFSEYSLPQTTLRDGYANSVDRAIVLAAMLKATGIEFEFVPVTSTPALPVRMRQVISPAENICTALLLYLPQLNIFLNDSGIYGTPGILRHSGNIIFRSIDRSAVTAGALSACNNRNGTVVDCAIDLKADGSATVSVDYTFCGNILEIERERFARSTPALQRQYIETGVADFDAGAKLLEYSFDPDKQPQLTVKWHIDRFAGKTGKFVFFRLPEYRKFENLFHFSSPSRRTPYLFSGNRFCRINYRINVPDNYTLIRNTHPEKTVLSGVFWRKDYRREQSVHFLDFLLEIQADMSDPAIFHRLLDLSGAVNHNDSKKVLFVTE
ncbi:MAG: DUF3857 domain-containing protein [Lentisphaeria bacterium]|nr:DUF3857 domain-containing protein [Lentisphaeria bacterium]